MSWEPEIIDGVIKLPRTQNNIDNLEEWVKKKIIEHGKFTKKGKPSIPPNLPKIFLGKEEYGIKNKAGKGDLSVDKFRVISKNIGSKYEANRQARIALANLNPLNARNYKKWNKFVKGIMHHSGPAAVTGQLVQRIEELADANWKPSMGITSAGKNFLRNLYKRLDVHGGNSLLNFDFYPNEDIHQQAHRIFTREGIDLEGIGKLTKSFKTPNEVYSWVKNNYKPVIDKVTEELGDFSLRKSGLKEGTVSLFQKTPHLFKDFLEQNKGKITKASLVKFATSAPKTLASQADMFIPDEKVADKFRNKEWSEGLSMYRDQLTQDFLTTGLFAGITKGIMAKGGAGAALGGGGLLGGVVLPVAATGYALHRLDENVFQGAGKKFLREEVAPVIQAAKEGEEYTNVMHKETPQFGGGYVKYEKLEKNEDGTPKYGWAPAPVWQGV